MKHATYHTREKHKSETVLKWSIVLLSIFIIIEVWGWVITNSLALLGDAGHLATDVLALCVTLFGFYVGKRKPTDEYSYGYRRSEVLAALFNAIAWFVLFGFIIYESIRRIVHVEAVDPLPMIGIAVIGLLANIVVFKLLHAGHSHDNINMRGAILHVLMDIFGSVAAIVAGIIIYFTDWYYADPIMSVILAGIILRSGWELLRDSVNILMERKPDNIDIKKLKETLMTYVDDVIDVHHIHIWEISSGQVAATLHISLIDGGSCNDAIYNAKKTLHKEFGIVHATIQAEHGNCPDEELFYDV
jgi:cobalt-zinc-cadmium efflux system protein